HAGRHHLEPNARALGADAQRDPFIRLDADHDQRGDAALPAPADAEHRRVAQLDDDLGRASLQRLARAHENGHAVPPPVLDAHARDPMPSSSAAVIRIVSTRLRFHTGSNNEFENLNARTFWTVSLAR